MLKSVSHDTLEIKSIAVDRAYQGRGIGTALLQHASENAAKRGAGSLLIGTGDNSVRQLAFYQRLGFRKFSVIKNFFTDNYPEPVFEDGKQLKDMILLRKDI